MQENGNQPLPVIAKGLLALAGIAAIVALIVIFVANSICETLLALFDKFSSLDAAIVVALITGCVSILTVVGGAIANNILSNKHKKQEYLRKHREEPYTQLIAVFYKVLKYSKKDIPYSQDELLEDMTQFSQGLTLWGSSKAIKKWGEWRTMSAKEPANPYDIMHGMEAVLVQLRKDMGEKRGLQQGDLLKLFVNDYDEAVDKRQHSNSG